MAKTIFTVIHLWQSRILFVCLLILIGCNKSYYEKISDMDLDGRNIYVKISPIPEKEGEIVPSQLPDDYVTSNSVLEIEGTAHDGAGIEKIEILVNDQIQKTVLGKEYWKAEVRLLEGKNLVKAKLVSRNGETAESEAIVINYLLQKVTALPESMIGFFSLRDGNDLYFGSGWGDAEIVKSYYRYNIDENRFYRLKDIPLGILGSLPIMHDGKIYYFGGAQVQVQYGYMVRNYGINKMQVYNVLSDEWVISDIPFSVFGAAIAKIGEKVYVIGGIVDISIILGTGFEQRTLSTQVWEYDLLSHSWSQKADLPRNFIGSSFVVRDEKIFLMGGAEWKDNSFVPIRNIYYYDVYNQNFIDTGYLLNIDRLGAGAGVIGNKAYIMGGHSISGEETRVVEVLNLDDYTVEEIRNVSFGLSDFSVISYQNKIYILGGGANNKNEMIIQGNENILMYNPFEDDLNK